MIFCLHPGQTPNLLQSGSRTIIDVGKQCMGNLKFNLTKRIASCKREVKEREKKRRGQQRGEKNVRMLQSSGDAGHLPPFLILIRCSETEVLEMTIFLPTIV